MSIKWPRTVRVVCTAGGAFIKLTKGEEPYSKEASRVYVLKPHKVRRKKKT